MGLTLRRGRLFAKSDRFDEPALTARTQPGVGAAIVTESVARTLWPGRNAIGQHVRVLPGGQGAFWEIVGVVADAQFTSLGAEPVLHVFLPWAQHPTSRPRLVVRAAGEAAALAPAVREAVLAEYAATGIDRVVPLETLVNRATAPARVITQLMAGLGLLALSLAAVGVYGSLSLLVNARARETAVRLALGASPARTVRRIMFHGLAPVVLGGLGGVALAVALISVASSLLFDIDRVDVPSLLGGGFVVFAGCAAACIAPALRAARTEPMALLRN